MSTTETAAPPAHPDLLPLLEQGKEGVERYACIVLAMLNGARWVRADALWLLLPVGGTIGNGPIMGYVDADGVYHETATRLCPLPNPLADTEAGRAAAWELETRELIGWIECDGMHQYEYATGKPYGPWHSDRRRAAVLAVLKKHAEGNLSHLIRPLLDKMTEEPV